jgi:hypothetical protein
MPTILIVEKSGVIKESNIKAWVEADLYKKAGFKSPENFSKAHEWTIDGTTVALYGKTLGGKAGQENKYDFPPPVDTTLFFGSCILTIANGEGSLKAGQWETIYEILFGGFEDIGSEDSDESEDEDDELDLPRTKEGYVKDDFIVDDDELEDDDEDDDDDDADDDDDDLDDDEEEVVKKVSTKTNTRALANSKAKTKASTNTTTKTKAKPSKKLTVFEKIDTDNIENSFLDCTSELEEELYEE